MKYKISQVNEILKYLDTTIKNKEPFSLIRFGDGGLKMMNAHTENNNKNISIISKKEGVPSDKFKDVILLWTKYANDADYIDTPMVYDKKYFWGRYKKDNNPINFRTQNLLNNWEKVYNNVDITTINRKYCNPEFNWLVILNDQYNLLNLMKGRKICFISVFNKINRLNKYNIDFIQVVDHYENQYKNSFPKVMTYIEKNINKYDIWLNSSGELGRLYSGRIRELGGRVIDMGFVAQYWNNFIRPERFNNYIEPDMQNSLQMKLTTDGLKFKRNI